MSSFVPAADCVVATFLVEQGDVLMSWMPTFRKVGGGINIFNLTSFTIALGAYYKDNMHQYTANDCAYQLTQCRRQHFISDIAASTSVGAGTLGSLGNHAPNVLALRVELRTDVDGREGRGSVYWPSLSLDLVDGDDYNASAVTGIVGQLNGLRTWLTGQGWEWVLRSKWLGGVLRPACLVNPVTSIFALDNTIDVQRRRKSPPPDADGDMLVSFE